MPYPFVHTLQAQALDLASASPRHTSLQRLNLTLKPLDLRVTLLQVLVQAVTLRDELLLPLPEPLLLDLDLFREPLAQRLLFLLELWVVQLPWPCFAELARLHLLCAVRLIVRLFSCVDQVKHVRANEDGAQLLEIAVLLVLDLSNTPGILATLDVAVVGGRDVALGTDNGEGHGGDQAAGVLETGLVVLLERRLVDLDALCVDNVPDLQIHVSALPCHID